MSGLQDTYLHASQDSSPNGLESSVLQQLLASHWGRRRHSITPQSLNGVIRPAVVAAASTLPGL
jgi:hypothetical protein